MHEIYMLNLSIMQNCETFYEVKTFRMFNVKKQNFCVDTPWFVCELMTTFDVDTFEIENYSERKYTHRKSMKKCIRIELVY